MSTDVKSTDEERAARIAKLPAAFRERMWKPGQTGNTKGVVGEYTRCLSLCRANSHEAAQEVIRLAHESEDERVRYMAATWVYERAWGKGPTFDPSKEAPARPKFNPRDYSPEELDLIEAALRLIKRGRATTEAEILPPEESEAK